ncbi:MAG TPA: hypothetical protein VFA18_07410, partial [Gemmataceae bacterium]|nr:hypothetical protein [Gemmataceae bacterium]
TAQAVRQATAETAKELSGKIEFAERKAELATAGVSLELSNQLKETEQRVLEVAHADALQQLASYRDQSRQGALMMKSRVKRLDAALQDLARQMNAEQSTLLKRLAQSEARQQAAEERLRSELTHDVDDAQSQARVEVEKLRQLVTELMQRVSELERPGWLRRLVSRLAFWQRAEKAPGAAALARSQG